MARYRVHVRTTSFEIVDADNPYMAAVVASGRHRDGAVIADVRPAVRRSAVKTAKKKTTKTFAKKRRRLSPEARAKLAQNLVKARAARAAKAKKTKKTSKKSTKRR